MSAYLAAIGPLLRSQALDFEQSAALIAEFLDGALSPPQMAAILTASAAKGESVEELTVYASAMRARALTITCDEPVLDTCGTGGSGLETANTSTLSAFVVAAAGVKVAKHGNRASSGKCGSMDVLEHLGVNIELTPAHAERLLRSGPVVFMYARRHHPALAHITPVRSALGFRTFFNLLGPICNPAGARLQVLGVGSPDRAPLIAECLLRLGSDRALVVWAEDGLDEQSTAAPTRVWELRNGEIEHHTWTPEQFGVTRVQRAAIRGGDVAANVAIFESVIEGRERGPHTDLTALNAGAALYVAGRASSIAEGTELAHGLIRSGSAAAVFDAYRRATREFA